MTPKEVLALCREKDVKSVDLKFMDFPGLWQHFTIPVDKLDEDVFEDGLGFDGSTIRGWQAINESDMLVMPQPETAFIDPFCEDPTLSMICNIQDPVTREDYSRDPAQHRPQGRQLHEEHGHRRDLLLRPRAGVLHFRRHPLRSEPQQRLLLHRQHRGRVERGPRTRSPISATRSATRKAISRCRRRISCRTSARK